MKSKVKHWLLPDTLPEIEQRAQVILIALIGMAAIALLLMIIIITRMLALFFAQ